MEEISYKMQFDTSEVVHALTKLRLVGYSPAFKALE